MLYCNVYAKIYQSLSPMDRKFVKAMTEYPEQDVPVHFIGKTLNKPNPSLASLHFSIYQYTKIAPFLTGAISYKTSVKCFNSACSL